MNMQYAILCLNYLLLYETRISIEMYNVFVNSCQLQVPEIRMLNKATEYNSNYIDVFYKGK